VFDISFLLYAFNPDIKKYVIVILYYSSRKSNLERIFPILAWGPEYTGKKAISDVIAGVTVGTQA
jgi:hypothetical protein